VPAWVTFGRVTVPICLPAILEIWVYLFVSAMTTVSAVIFLYGPDTKPASVAMVHMDEAGQASAAAAMACVLLAATTAGEAGAAGRRRAAWARHAGLAAVSRWEKGTSPPAPPSTFLATVGVSPQRTKKGGGAGEVLLPRRLQRARRNAVG
jgi:hypothetical protein